MPVRNMSMAQAFRPWEQWPRVGSQWPTHNVESEQNVGLGAWWPPLASRFGGDVLRDMTGRGNDGSFVGIGQPAWKTDAEHGSVLRFDGTNDSINIDTIIGEIGISAGAISTWVKLDSSILADNNVHPIVEIGEGAVAGDLIGLRKTADNTIIQRFRDGSNDDAIIADISDFDNWHLLVGVWDVANVVIYKDGVLVDTTALSGTPTLSIARIGEDTQTAGSYYKGFLSDTRVYTTLTPSQVYDLWHPRTRWELYQIPPRRWVLAPVAAPSVTIAVTRAAATVDAAPYTQDFTTPDLQGLTPKAALFIVTRATADGTETVDGCLGYGAATAADQEWATTQGSEDAQGTTNTGRSNVSDHCLVIPDVDGDNVDGEAEFSAFIANGVRVNWTDAPSAAFLVTVVLFAGADLSAYAGQVALGDAEDNAVDVTAPGFEPDLVLTAAANNLAADVISSVVRNTYGVIHNNGAVTQRSFTFYSANGEATSALAARYTESYGGMLITSSGNLDSGYVFSGFDANGYTITTVNAGANNTTLGYLALNFNGAVSSWVGTMDTPTSTGNDVQTGPNFTPQIVALGMTSAQALDTAYTDGDAGVIGFSVFDADDEYSNTVADEDAQATSDTQCVSDDQAVHLDEHDGTPGHAATFVTLDAIGWTLNFSATLGAARKWWAWAIEDAQAGQAVPPKMYYYRRRRTA